MAGLFDSFPDEAPGGSTAPASGGGLFDSFPDAERATSASPATPEGVPTLRPGTDRAAAPPAPTPLPGPKAGWYTGPRGIGKVYTDPSSASSIIARAGGEGLASGIQDIANIVHPFSDTNAPRPLNPEDPLAKTLAEPLSQGWKDPKWWAAQLAHGAGYMMPAIGAAALAPEGALPQGLAFGITNMAQTLAPAYTRARQAGETPEQAADTAWKSAGVAGAFGVAMGMVPAATVFGRLVESQAKQALIRIGEQTFIAQPALGAGQQAATNLVEGRPTGEGVPEAAVMTAAQGAVLGARHAAQAGAAALAEGRQPAAAPSPPGGGTGGGPDGGTGAGAPPPAAPPPTAPPPGGAATTADLLRQVRPEQPAPVAQTPPAEPPAAAAAEPPSKVAPVSVAAAGEAQQQTAAELAQARQTPGQEDRAKVLEQEQKVLEGAAAPLPGEKQAAKGKGQPRVAPPAPESPAEPQATSPASALPAAPVAALAPEPKPEPPAPPAEEAAPVREPEPEPPPPPIETGPLEDLFRNVPSERRTAPQSAEQAVETPPSGQAPAPQEPGPAAGHPGLALADMVRQHMAGDQPLTPRALRERLDQYGLEDVQLAFARRILDGRAHGQYDRKLITLALDLPGYETRTLDHEAIHALRDLGLFTDGEWQALVRAARVAEAPSGRPGETIGRLVARIYKGASPEQADEEAVATFHSYWRDGLYEPKGLAGRALQKVADFFERIGNWLRGAGFRSADDVLKAVGRGEIGARRRPNEMVGPGMVSAAQATPKGSGALRPAAEARSTVSATASGGNDMLSYARREPDTRRFGIPPEAGAPISSYPHAGRLKMHPAFAAAKAGDLAAAVRLVSDLVSPKMAEEVRRRFGPDDLFVPVIAEEASGRNAIPRQLAEHLAAIAGAHTATGIVQTTRSYHTGAGAMERLISRPRFAGPVQPGRRYVLVDDVTTMGGTLAELAHHIQEGGGKVAGVVTLANASRLGVWVPRPQQIREIERRFGDAVREATGIEPAALTAAEAHYVLNFRDADSFRARVASAMGQRGERLRAKGVRASEATGAEGEGEGLASPGGGGSGPKYSLRDEPERAAIAAFERGDPETATRAMPVMGRILQSRAGGIIGDIVRDLQIKAAPMAAGSDPARAMAKDFANAERKARWQWQRIDEILKRRFAPDRRREMGAALDEESVAAQTGQDLRGTGRGLERLTPDERAAVEMLDRYGRELWARAQAADMVRGEGLPFYMPRFLVQMTAEGARRLPEARRGVSAIEPMGRNLTTTTSNLLHRKHLTPEETEAAARQKFGDETALVTDIRALPLALGRLERAIAGRELINGIKEFGARTGQETVRAGEAPGYFTIDHPAFQRFQPRLERTENGWSIVKDQAGRPIFDRVPLYVSRNFEGPLRAVLTRPAGAIYNGLMALKGKSMSVIMYSPLIHNAVEWGRALPLMPGKVLTLRVYFEGNAFKRDPEAMGQAIVDGLVPIGARGAEADITSIAAEPTLEPGRSWTAKAAGLAARPFGEAASQHAMALVDRMGDWWHGTLLWDRVGDLQAGIYKNVRDDLIRRGTDPGSAGRIAAHLANRYAGALPREAMSDMARKIGNIVLFSRSFTLGNLGVIKDMVTGLPKDVQAQILRDGGELARVAAVSATRRAAIKAFVIDVALLYGMNAALQTALDMLLRDKTLDQVAKGYVDRFHALLQKARENPLEALNPFEDIQALSPTSANEPGKEDRVLWGYDARGTAIYLRNPVGKLGEEFKGWVTSPLDMIRRKESTIVRPLFEVLANDRGFGRQVYDPNDRSLAGIAAAAGRIAWHFLTSQIPTDTIQAAYDAVTGQGDQRANAFKVLGPMVGLTFSKGAPGGPAVGELFRLREQHAQAVAAAMPGINRAIQRGEVPQAIEAMVKLGMTPGEIRTRLRYALDPGSRLNPRALRQVQRYADPGEFQRLLDMQDEQQP